MKKIIILIAFFAIMISCNNVETIEEPTINDSITTELVDNVVVDVVDSTLVK